MRRAISTGVVQYSTIQYCTVLSSVSAQRVRAILIDSLIFRVARREQHDGRDSLSPPNTSLLFQLLFLRKIHIMKVRWHIQQVAKNSMHWVERKTMCCCAPPINVHQKARFHFSRSTSIQKSIRIPLPVTMVLLRGQERTAECYLVSIETRTITSFRR